MLTRCLLWIAALLVVKIHASSNSNGFPLAGTTPDPLVQASPLIVGVRCRDGVLLLAAHSVFANDDECALVLGTEKNTSPNLPKSYRGPFRIHTLRDDHALVCAGFRVDAGLLAEHLQSIDNNESMVFGTSPTHLADRASLFLAQHMVSGSKRSLSCAGLLATTNQLFLVDATGAYAVRCHALGKQSNQANEILRKTDWSKMPSDQVRDDLLQTLLDEDAAILPKGSRVELALVGSASVKRLLATER